MRIPPRPTPALPLLITMTLLALAAFAPSDAMATGATEAPDVVPPTATPIGFDGARHLLARTGFGGTWSEVQEFSKLTREEAVDRLLAGLRTTASTPAPEWTGRPPGADLPEMNRGKLTDEQRKELRQLGRRQGMELKAWWMQEMVETDSPLTERLVLFWHNHFTSSLRKVKAPGFLYQQNALLRRFAAGSFAELTHEIVRDPAMIIYLDTQRSSRGKPNENFARELLELFTLGEGHYTESDIKEAARAFTGIRVQRRTGKGSVVRRRHDAGEKSFLGLTGPLDDEAVVDRILEQPRVSVYLTEKFWGEFISPTPDPAEVQRLAKVIRTSNYQMRPFLRTLFLSEAFWASQNRGVLIKSPVELVVGTSRTFGLPWGEPRRVVALSRSLGQDLFDPPNVKGWPGGVAWISSATLLLREQYLERVFRGLQLTKSKKRRQRRMGERMSSVFNAWLADIADSPDVAAKRAERLLLPISPVEPREAGDDPFESLLRVVLDPTYQLK